MSPVELIQKKHEIQIKSMSRRDFFTTTVYWAITVAMSSVLFGLLRFPKPALFPDIPRIFKIGKPEDYPPGSEKIFEEKKVIVRRDTEGLYAISLICTHLGCIVSKHADRFECPCHGSKFDERGKVTAGPAPKALEWFKVSQLPDGKLVVDTMRKVPIGTRYSI
ncbi:MAG TPA: Rieske 2Fe-2S domain-containing protein [Candidatus Omnitrophota bacterium]|nr:Rieske 2Fe-2S domain-containing protein [Candidatus Omnitrophota bacterium]